MTDTSNITLHHRDPETHAVLLRWNGGVGWGEPQETAEWHEKLAVHPDFGATEAMHAALAVMRRALDEAEDAGVDIEPPDEDGYHWFNCRGWGFHPGHPDWTPIDRDDVTDAANLRAARHLAAEVFAVVDDPVALAALPYDVRDHRTPTVPADQPRPAGIPNGDVTWSAADETAASIAAAFTIGEYPVPSHVSAVFAPAEDDEPETVGEVPAWPASVTITGGRGTLTYRANLADSPEPVTFPNYSGTPTPTRRTFPPAPAAATDTPEEQARKLLEYHTRRHAGGCACGWNVWGASFALHLAATLNGAGLLFGTRAREEWRGMDDAIGDLARERDQLRDELLGHRSYRTIREHHDKLDAILREAMPVARPAGILAGLRAVVAQRDEAWNRIDALTADAEDAETESVEPADSTTDPEPVASYVADDLARKLYAHAIAMRPDADAPAPRSPWAEHGSTAAGARTFWRALAHLAITETTPEQQS